MKNPRPTPFQAPAPQAQPTPAQIAQHNRCLILERAYQRVVTKNGQLEIRLAEAELTIETLRAASAPELGQPYAVVPDAPAAEAKS